MTSKHRKFLTEAQKKAIRLQYNFPPYRATADICKEFGCSDTAITKISGGACAERVRVIRARAANARYKKT